MWQVLVGSAGYLGQGAGTAHQTVLGFLPLLALLLCRAHWWVTNSCPLLCLLLLLLLPLLLWGRVLAMRALLLPRLPKYKRPLVHRRPLLLVLLPQARSRRQWRHALPLLLLLLHRLWLLLLLLFLLPLLCLIFRLAPGVC